MNKVILITGATGVIGQPLIQSLSENLPDVTLVCLTHKQSLDHPNVVAISGDITKSDLGLTARLYDDLVQRVDCIVHLGANTNFAKPIAEIRRTNVDGVRHILTFKAKANTRLIHASTAFIHASGGHELNNYELSKFEAEQVIQESGMPVVIVRPSIVIGDSNTGAISKLQGIHYIIRLLINEALPVVPGVPESYIDFVPQNHIAEAITALVKQGVSSGEYWLTAGRQAISFGEILNLIAEYATQITNRTVAAPRIVSPNMFERLIRPVFLAEFRERERRIFTDALIFAKYFDMEEPFPSSFGNLVNEFGIPPLPDPKQSLLHSVRHIISQGKRPPRASKLR